MEEGKKYNDIIEAAENLFYKYGIRKVNIEEICTNAKVSKMTFYKYFSNKIELAKTVIDKIFEESFERFRRLMDSDIPFTIKMQGLLQMKIESSKGVHWDFVIDLYRNPDSELAEYIHQYIQIGTKSTLNYFAEAQKRGQMRSDINSTLLLVILDKLQDIAFDNRVLAAYDNTQDLTMEITKFFLYGIFEER
jgi:AcrR family transcriptional regulator